MTIQNALAPLITTAGDAVDLAHFIPPSSLFNIVNTVLPEPDPRITNSPGYKLGNLALKLFSGYLGAGYGCLTGLKNGVVEGWKQGAELGQYWTEKFVIIIPGLAAGLATFNMQEADLSFKENFLSSCGTTGITMLFFRAVIAPKCKFLGSYPGKVLSILIKGVTGAAKGAIQNGSQFFSYPDTKFIAYYNTKIISTLETQLANAGKILDDYFLPNPEAAPAVVAAAPERVARFFERTLPTVAGLAGPILGSGLLYMAVDLLAPSILMKAGATVLSLGTSVLHAGVGAAVNLASSAFGYFFS